MLVLNIDFHCPNTLSDNSVLVKLMIIWLTLGELAESAEFVFLSTTHGSVVSTFHLVASNLAGTTPCSILGHDDLLSEVSTR